MALFYPFIGNILGIRVLSTFSKTPGFLSSNLSCHKATQCFYTPNCTISHFETRYSTYSTIKSLPRADQLEHPPGQYLQRVNTPQYCYIYIISRIIKIQAHLKLFYLKTRKGWAPSLTELDNTWKSFVVYIVARLQTLPSYGCTNLNILTKKPSVIWISPCKYT